MCVELTVCTRSDMRLIVYKYQGASQDNGGTMSSRYIPVCTERARTNAREGGAWMGGASLIEAQWTAAGGDAAGDGRVYRPSNQGSYRPGLIGCGGGGR